jgi:hypothetical protein
VKGDLDLIDFVNHHTPAVILYDISPPYDANWRFSGSCAARNP